MGVVSTNVCVIKGGGSGGGANGADLPTHLKALSANGGNGFVTLSIEYENTDFVSGVQVNYKLGNYPTSPSDGDSVSVEGAPTSIKVEGLTNKLEYYFRVFPYNEVDGTKYYQTDVTNAKVECIPKALEIVGATIFEEGDGYVALITSQDFTLSAPAGTKITLAGGGSKGQYRNGGIGGYVQQHILAASVDNQQCSLNVGAASKTYGTSGLTSTTLTVGSETYTSGTQASKTIQTKFGIIGGNGKNGGDHTDRRSNDNSIYYWGEGGNGGGARAGNGGPCSVTADTSTGVLYCGGDSGGNGTKGGSEYRIKNINNSGSYYSPAGGKGANGCGNGGGGLGSYQPAIFDDEVNQYWIGSGGGGGGFGGGGGGGGGRSSSSSGSPGGAGDGGQGICVIEYPE